MVNGWSLNPGLNYSLNPLFHHPQKSKEGALLAPDRLFKVVLVGNSSVGKTSLLRSFCEGRFHPSTIATVGEKKKNPPHCNHIPCVFWSHSDGTCVSARWQHKRSEGDLAVTWKGSRSHTGRLRAPAHIVQQIMSLLMNSPSLLSSFPKPLARTWC